MKVFLSCSDAQSERARELAQRLRSRNIDLVDDESSIAVGQDWRSAIESGIRDADAIVFIVEPGGQRDARLQEEWRYAIDQSWSRPRKPMIPVVFGNAQVPGFLKDRQALTVDDDDDWDRVSATLVATLSGEIETPQVNADESATRAAERKQRLQEISQEATKLAPKPEELLSQIETLRIRIADESARQPASMELAELHVEVADLLKRVGRERDALPELTAAANILVQHPEAEPRLARIRSNLGTLFWRLGDKQQARMEFESARDIYLKIEGAESMSALLARLSLVTVYKDLGENAAAEREQQAFASGATKKVVGLAERFAIPVLGRFITRLLQRDKKPHE